MKYYTLMIFMLMLNSSPANSDGFLDYSDYLHWTTGSIIPQEATYDTAVFGNNLYCAGPEGICIYKLGSETSSYMGKVGPNRASSRISVAHGILVADCYGNWNDPSLLQVFDLSDPDTPVLIGKIQLPTGRVMGLATNGRLVFVGTQSMGILVYDIRETANNRFLGDMEIDLNWNNIFKLCGDLLVTGDGYNKSLIDISNPRNLVELSTIGGYFSGVARDGDLLFFTSYNEILAIWDISNPGEPFEISSTNIQMSSGRDIQVRSGFAYIATAYNGGGILTYDISNPTDPEFLGETRVPQESHSVDLIGEWAIATGRLSTFSSRFDVFDISNPNQAPVVTQWYPNYTNFNAISVQETIGYISNLGEDSVYIVDLNDVHFPVLLAEISSFSNPRAVASGPGWVAVSGWSNEVQIFNTEIPADPVLVSTIPLPNGSNELAYSDGLLAVPCFDSGITIIDMSDVNQPAIISELPYLGSCYSPQFQGRVLFTSRVGEILAIDCSFPQEPVVSVIGEIPGYSCEIAVKDDHVYCSSFSTLRVFDATTGGGPELPLIEYQIPVNGRIIIEDEVLYMTSCGALWVFDINNECRLIGNGPVIQSQSFQSIDNLAGFGPYILGTAGYGGLVVFSRQENSVQPTHWGLIKEKRDFKEEGDLMGVFPNPFNPQATITFSLNESQQVRVAVFDIRGQLVAELTNQQYEAGEHSVDWMGRDLSGRAVPSGEYFFRMEKDGQFATRKAMLVR